LLISESRKTSYIVIEKEKCKACHYCIAVCPKEIIGVSKDINRFGVNYAEPIEEKAHECTGCKSCAIMCPDIAISVYRNRVLEGDKIS
jgi:2-oxoglutarate ferredoxin oxidoreductase subunit delta